MKISSLLITLGLSLSFMQAQTLRFYQVDDLNDYNQVLDLGISKESLLFIAIIKDDGGFERMVREDVFRSDTVINSFSNVVPMAVFAKSEMGSRFIESFGEKPLPVFYLINLDEFLLKYHVGTMSAPSLAGFMYAGKAVNKKLPQLKKAYGEHTLDLAGWQRLLGLYELNFDYLATQGLALELLAEVPIDSILNPGYREISLNYGINLETPYPQSILERKEQLDSLEFAEFYEATYSFNFDLAAENKDTSLLNVILTQLLPYSTAPDSTLSELVYSTKELFAAETGLFEIWQEAVLDACKEIDDTTEKADFAFNIGYIIANDYNSSSAQETARNLAKQASEWKVDYRYKMLEAYMSYLLGEYEKAEILVTAAIELADSEDDLTKSERLKTIIVSERGAKEK